MSDQSNSAIDNVRIRSDALAHHTLLYLHHRFQQRGNTDDFIFACENKIYSKGQFYGSDPQPKMTQSK
jgi:hypothetical protein